MNVIQHQAVNRLERTQKAAKPVGLTLALALAAGIYWQSSSIWLALFGFVMVSRFVIGCVPKIIFHGRRLYRTTFYLLWPVGGTVMLYLVYQLWQILWRAAILGIFGGMLFSVFVGVLFFRDVAMEERQREEQIAESIVEKQLAANPDALAMKKRFTSSEWEEIKQFPWMIMGIMTASGDTSKAGIKAASNVWVEAQTKPEEYEDPLLRMMFIDFNAGVMRSAGQMTSLSQLSSALVDGVLKRQFETLAGAGRLEMEIGDFTDVSPEAMLTVEANLSPGEFRSFIRGLMRLGWAIATAGGTPKQDQIDMLLKFIPAENKEDFLAMFGVEGDRWTLPG